MATTICTINLKGGVGKTTITVALAEFLAFEHGLKVLVIDLDPQTNATVALLDEMEWKKRNAQGRTLCQLFADQLDHGNKFDLQKTIARSVSNLSGGVPNLDLIPSSLDFIDIQDRLVQIGSGHFYKRSPVDVVKTALGDLLDAYDYCIIDCPPNLGIVTLNGINIADYYLVPVVPDVLSTYGIPQIRQRIEKFAHEADSSIASLGIVISKFRVQSPLHRDTIERLRNEEKYQGGLHVFDTVIPEAGKIADAADVNTDVRTLRQKYGYGNNYETLSKLTQEVRDNV